MRERTRDGRRETRPTAADRLAAQLSTQRGDPLSGGDVARMRPEERRRLLMRLGFLSGRTTVAELRVALVHLPGCTLPPEHGGRCVGRPDKEPPRAATLRGHGRGAISDGTRLAASNEALPRGDGKAIDRDTRSVGRPAVAGEPRDVVVRLRATEAERDAWQASAERAGLPLSEWIRARLN